VLGLPYRHPAVLAKMAESFDRLSGGRLTLGIGGGGNDSEFRGFGLDLRDPGDKVDALEEAILVLRGMWTERSFTFRGKHFHTDRAEMEPKPDRHIPIWTGSYGKRSLAVTGRRADGWIPSFRYVPPARARVLIGRVRSAAEDSGRDPSQLTLGYNVGIRVDEDGDPRPYVVSGPPERCAERLREFMDLGFTALNLWPAGPDLAAQRDRLADEVAPLLGDGGGDRSHPFATHPRGD
jgi:alkanesulfonate monooxygenase SsuD/methylene tetrahydromethanopterin reductase-like flavin-dependent oxidoreductase (luciferase family)